MTAKTDLEARKYRLISRIAAIQKTEDLEKLEAVAEKTLPATAIKPLRKNITLDEILTEQKFKGFDRKKLDKLIEEIAIEEPIEDLLALLN